jgi:hypothetical protein
MTIIKESCRFFPDWKVWNLRTQRGAFARHVEILLVFFTTSTFRGEFVYKSSNRIFQVVVRSLLIFNFHIHLPKLSPLDVNKVRTPGRLTLDDVKNIKQLKKQNIHEIPIEDILTTKTTAAP